MCEKENGVNTFRDRRNAINVKSFTTLTNNLNAITFDRAEENELERDSAHLTTASVQKHEYVTEKRGGFNTFKIV